MSRVNYYKVLELENDCSQEEIKTAYNKLVKLYHPDRKTGNSEIYQLINHAYEILGNVQKRQEYDDIVELSNKDTKDHGTLKSEYTEFSSNLTSEPTKEEIDRSLHKFKIAFKQMDLKHGIDRNQTPITKEQTDDLLNDLELAREQDDIEAMPKDLFENDGNFNNAKFNEVFEKLKKGKENIIKYDKPTFFNDNGYEDFSKTNGEELYTDDTGIYSSVDNGYLFTNTSNIDMSNVCESDATLNHNKITENYTKSLEDKMKEIQEEREKLENMTFNDFNKDVDCGDYGFLNEIATNATAELEFDNASDLNDRYNKLLEHRK